MMDALGITLIVLVCFGIFFSFLNLISKILYGDKNPYIKKTKKTKEPKKSKKIKYDYDEYKMYLKTPAWRFRKAERYQKDNGQCQMCLKQLQKYQAECHHLNYRRLYSETSDDLATLCKQCHELVHKTHGKNAKDYPLILLGEK